MKDEMTSLDKRQKFLSSSDRKMLMQKFGGRCFYCGCLLTLRKGVEDVEKAVFDHLIPRRLGGRDEASNIVTSCRECNHLKGHLPPSSFMTSTNPPDYEVHQTGVYPILPGELHLLLFVLPLLGFDKDGPELLVWPTTYYPVERGMVYQEAAAPPGCFGYGGMGNAILQYLAKHAEMANAFLGTCSRDEAIADAFCSVGHLSSELVRSSRSVSDSRVVESKADRDCFESALSELLHDGVIAMEERELSDQDVNWWVSGGLPPDKRYIRLTLFKDYVPPTDGTKVVRIASPQVASINKQKVRKARGWRA